jgi:hypothetical protein
MHGASPLRTPAGPERTGGEDGGGIAVIGLASAKDAFEVFRLSLSEMIPTTRIPSMRSIFPGLMI